MNRIIVGVRAPRAGVRAGREGGGGARARPQGRGKAG